MVEIMSVVCEVGDCIKVVVCSYNLNVDVIGIIVGCGGVNIKKIISKFYLVCYDVKSDCMVLIEENIDVIEWVVDLVEFIYNVIVFVEVD